MERAAVMWESEVGSPKEYRKIPPEKVWNTSETNHLLKRIGEWNGIAERNL